MTDLHLYEIDQEAGRRHAELTRTALLADVRDARRINALLAAERPEIVFHAAALKHVPMVEAHPDEGILTNAIGTRIVADACVKHGVGAMVVIWFISQSSWLTPESSPPYVRNIVHRSINCKRSPSHCTQGCHAGSDACCLAFRPC